jgi:hypothetical protein
VTGTRKDRCSYCDLPRTLGIHNGRGGHLFIARDVMLGVSRKPVLTVLPGGLAKAA